MLHDQRTRTYQLDALGVENDFPWKFATLPQEGKEFYCHRIP